MGDISEEQTMEVEAIQSIYPSEFESISEDPISFRITFDPEKSDVDAEYAEKCNMKLGIKFTFTPTYPAEVPLLEVENLEGLLDTHVNDLTSILVEMAEQNVGMGMVFTLASRAKEWLDETFVNVVKYTQSEDERRRLEAEELEHKKFVGTLVTPETFAAWRKKFEAEMREIEAKENKKNEENKKKLTGKQLFETDSTLYLQEGLEEGDVVVEVDESLFEDIDDELEDELREESED